MQAHKNTPDLFIFFCSLTSGLQNSFGSIFYEQEYPEKLWKRGTRREASLLDIKAPCQPL